MSPKDKPLVWLSREVKTPPFSTEARIEAGFLDASQTWRIVYRVDADAIVIAEVFSKKQQSTPAAVIRVSKDRFRRYDTIVRGNA